MLIINLTRFYYSLKANFFVFLLIIFKFSFSFKFNFNSPAFYNNLDLSDDDLSDDDLFNDNFNVELLKRKFKTVYKVELVAFL